MSHNKERGHKNCLNCNVIVQGRFCQACGQENVEHKLGFWAMVQHFVYDILHFDGKFFDTFRVLIIYPGRVARDYVNGRKVTYLDPVRMYLFISTIIFFLLPIFSSIQKTISKIHIIASPYERLIEASRNYQSLKSNPEAPEYRRSLEILLDTAVHLQLKDRGEATDTVDAIDFYVKGQHFKALPIEEEKLFPKGNWIERRVANKIKVQFENQGRDFNQLMFEQAQSQQKMMPYILFLSLPLFTLLLSLLYRKRSDLYYSDHAAFTLYHYILVFGLLGITPIFQLLLKVVGINSEFVFLPVLLLTLIHLLFELKLFYAQPWGITIVKFLLLIIAIGLLIAFLFLLISFLVLVI